MKRLLLAILVLAGSASAQLLVAPTTAECATSVDGSVVGVPNPLNPPILSTVFSGTLPPGNYFVQEAWYDASANTTLVGPEVSIQLSGTGEIQEEPPASGMSANAVGRNIYIGTTSGGETLQGTVVGTGAYTQSVPLIAGAAVPSANNTICNIIANDAGWPTGTGYQVTLTTPAGATVPGYPMQWQLLGPGNTINLGNGLPLYNGIVTYPIPILARPYGHGPQSISGPLSLSGYNLTNVNGLGAQSISVASTITINAAGGGGGVQLTNPAPGELLLTQSNVGQAGSGNGEVFVIGSNGTTDSCIGLIGVISNTVNGETQLQNCSSTIDAGAAMEFPNGLSNTTPFSFNWNAPTGSLKVAGDGSTSMLPTGADTFATLPASGNGAMIFCTDCTNTRDDSHTAGNVCAGSGHGALAVRENAHWNCF